MFQLILRLHLCIVLCAAAQSAWCAPVSGDAATQMESPEPSSDAILKARELGRGDGSVEGLQALIKQRQPKLIEYYGQFLGGWSYSKLSPGIETLIIQNMNDPLIGAALLRLTQNAKYQTRKLFESLDARIVSAESPDWVALSAIARTDLPSIEAELFKLAERFPASEFDQSSTAVLRFFGERKYVPAVSLLAVAMQKRKPGDPVAYSATDALAKIATQPATTAVLDRLEWLAKQLSDDPQAQSESQLLLNALSQMPETAPLNFSRLKKILSGKTLANNQQVLLEIARKRKELEAVPDFLSALVNEPQSAISNPAFKALLGFDSVEVWRKTRNEIERLYRAQEISDVYHASALRILDERLKEPEKIFAQSQQTARASAFVEKQSQINALKVASQPLKDSDPEKFIVTQLQFLEKLAALCKEYQDVGGAIGLRDQIAEDYSSLGNFVRFKLKQPAKAITLYERAPDSAMAGIAAADTARFDLHDSVSAIQHYERVLDLLKNKRVAGNDIEVAMSTWMRTWLVHEIAYLKTGKLFTGSLVGDDLSGFSVILFWGALTTHDTFAGLSPALISLAPYDGSGKSAPADVRNKLAKEIVALPASHLSLFASMGMVTMLPNADSVLQHFSKHDPTGYLTASLLGTVDLLNKQPQKSRTESAFLFGASVDLEMLNVVSKRFFMEHQITLNTGGDPRMASPEKTWALFIEALKQGDMLTAKSCLTPAMRAKLEPMLDSMNPARIKKMAESFSGFSVLESTDQYQEAAVVNGKHAGFIYFVNIGGAWKIQEM